MSKLSEADKFIDLSDYGRPLAKFFANQLKNTPLTPVHVTLLFGISGLIAIYCIIESYYWLAGFFIILKSVIDATDGELSRIRSKPSYFGRYLDSIFDIILNFLFLITICYVTKSSIVLFFLAFISIELQGTLYNFYYIILRNHSLGGDSTSKIFEDKAPIAFAGETQKSVNLLFGIFRAMYVIFDKTIYFLDKNASGVKFFPKWFMTLLSIYGLGFQLLIIAVMLPLQLIDYIIPFFIFYSFIIFVFIGIRKAFIK